MYGVLCITYVIYTPVLHMLSTIIHMFHTCNIGVWSTHVLQV